MADLLILAGLGGIVSAIAWSMRIFHERLVVLEDRHWQNCQDRAMVANKDCISLQGLACEPLRKGDPVVSFWFGATAWWRHAHGRKPEGYVTVDALVFECITVRLRDPHAFGYHEGDAEHLHEQPAEPPTWQGLSSSEKARRAVLYNGSWADPIPEKDSGDWPLFMRAGECPSRLT
jgi:hypothetical protein